MAVGEYDTAMALANSTMGTMGLYLDDNHIRFQEIRALVSIMGYETTSDLNAIGGATSDLSDDTEELARKTTDAYQSMIDSLREYQGMVTTVEQTLAQARSATGEYAVAWKEYGLNVDQAMITVADSMGILESEYTASMLAMKDQIEEDLGRQLDWSKDIGLILDYMGLEWRDFIVAYQEDWGVINVSTNEGVAAYDVSMSHMGATTRDTANVISGTLPVSVGNAAASIQGSSNLMSGSFAAANSGIRGEAISTSNTVNSAWGSMAERARAISSYLAGISREVSDAISRLTRDQQTAQSRLAEINRLSAAAQQRVIESQGLIGVVQTAPSGGGGTTTGFMTQPEVDAINAAIAAAIASGADASVFSGVPGFAEGGIVPGPTGRAMPAIVHGGERIISNEDLSKGRLRGSLIIELVNPTFLGKESDARQLVNFIKDALRRETATGWSIS